MLLLLPGLPIGDESVGWSARFNCLRTRMIIGQVGFFRSGLQTNINGVRGWRQGFEVSLCKMGRVVSLWLIQVWSSRRTMQVGSDWCGESPTRRASRSMSSIRSRAARQNAPRRYVSFHIVSWVLVL